MRKALRSMIATRSGRMTMITDAAGMIAVLVMAYGALFLPSAF